MHEATRTITRPVAMVVALMVTLSASLILAGQATAAPNTTDRVVAHNSQGTMKSEIFGKASDGSKVTGSFTPVKFMKRHGHEKVKGVVEGVVHHANGSNERFTAIRTVTLNKIDGQPIGSRSALSSRATCDVLHLVLGPLDLDLLGLQVHLDKVVLDIVAVTGAGNLLGNLLCAITGLLDGGPLGGLLTQLNSLLRQILAVLNLGV